MILLVRQLFLRLDFVNLLNLNFLRAFLNIIVLICRNLSLVILVILVIFP